MHDMSKIKVYADAGCKTCHGRGEYEENQSPLGSGMRWMETLPCDCLRPAEGEWDDSAGYEDLEIVPAPEWIAEQEALSKAEDEFASSWEPPTPEDEFDDDECEICGEHVDTMKGEAAEMALPDNRVVFCHAECGLAAGGEVA